MIKKCEMVRKEVIQIECDECGNSSSPYRRIKEINGKDICCYCEGYMITCTNCKEFTRRSKNLIYRCDECEDNLCEKCARELIKGDSVDCVICNRDICDSCSYIRFDTWEDGGKVDICVCLKCIKESPKYTELIKST